jgi:hypothetical protein
MNSWFQAIPRRHLVSFRRRPDLGFARGSGLSAVAARVRTKNSQQLELETLEHHRVVIKEFRERHAVHFFEQVAGGR